MSKINLIIPAKGTSKRVKNKNLHKINDKTLVYMACEKALLCKNVDDVYIDTESQKILYDLEDLIGKGLKVIRRPKELANNDIGANEMMVYGLHSISECDILLQTFSTSPLITPATIDRCVEQFLEKQKFYDSFFTVSTMQEYFWEKNSLTGATTPVNFSLKDLPNSYELEKIHMETHGLYGIKTEALIRLQRRVGESPLLIEIPKLESFDINDAEDLQIIKRLLDDTR